jgi:tetratricopeptide (TPR) repeat protein
MSTASANRYQIMRELGAGATSRVSLAVDLETGEEVAIKQLFETGTVQGGVRMRREFRALKRLEHPNIVKVFDFGDEDRTPYIVMEFVPGQDLSNWLEHNPELSAITHVFAQVADALFRVHTEGLIHRDLKPENIRVTPEGQAILMDFGLAKNLAGSVAITRVGAVVGTVLYMAPEQCRGAELDYRADLYALGALMFRAFTGQPPFPGESLAQVILSHIQQKPRSPRQLRPDLPESLETLILGLLSKHPLDRPQTAALVRDALIGILKDALGTSLGDENTVQEEADGIARADALLVAPLLGRDEELSSLMPMLELDRDAPLVAITGDAGIGKTRLLRSLEERAHSERKRLVWGEATLHDPTPFGAISRLIENLSRHHQAVLDGLPENARLELSRIAPMLGEAPAPDPALPPELLRLRLFEAFTTLLERTSKVAVLVLENLHWADESTLGLLAHATRTVSNPRLIVTYRVQDLPEGSDTPRGLARPGLTLDLAPLSDSTMRELLDTRLDGTLEASLAFDLVSQADGNPWVLEEQLKLMLESGTLKRRSGVYERKHTTQELPARIASNLDDLLTQRLSTLPLPALEFARASSVLGRSFLFEDARSLLEWDDEPALDALEQLVRARVVTETPGTRGEGYRFTHPLYAETLERGLISLRRKRLHTRAAERLEHRAPPMVLAQHYREAGDDTRALENALSAGRNAQAAFAYPLAERAYRLGLEASRALEANLRGLLCAHYLAQVLSATGRNDEAVWLWAQVIDQAPRLPGGETLAANSKISLVVVQRRQGSIADSLSLLGEPQRNTPLFDELCIELCAVYRALGDLPRARHYGLEALAEARRLGKTGTLVKALVNLGEVENALGRAPRAERLLRFATTLAERSENHQLRSLAWNNLGSTLYLQARDEEALEAWETAARSSRVIGDIAYQATLEVNIALILMGQDEFEEALKRFEDASTLSERAGYTTIQKHALYNAGLCEYALNRLERARQRFRSVTKHVREGISRVWITRITLALGDAFVLEIPELIGHFGQSVHRITQAELKLSLAQYEAVYALTQTENDDEWWFWTLARIHAAWRLGLDCTAPLERLKNLSESMMLQSALAREYTTFVELVVNGDWDEATRTRLLERIEVYRASPIGVFARDAAMALSGL